METQLLLKTGQSSLVRTLSRTKKLQSGKENFPVDCRAAMNLTLCYLEVASMEEYLKQLLIDVTPAVAKSFQNFFEKLQINHSKE